MEQDRKMIYIRSIGDFIRKNTVRVFGPGLWNSLPRNMRDAKTIGIFKVAYKTMLIGAI